MYSNEFHERMCVKKENNGVTLQRCNKAHDENMPERMVEMEVEKFFKMTSQYFNTAATISPPALHYHFFKVIIGDN